MDLPDSLYLIQRMPSGRPWFVVVDYGPHRGGARANTIEEGLALALADAKARALLPKPETLSIKLEI